MGESHHHRRRESRAMKKPLLLVLGILFSGCVAAQSWPSKPIRYIVPFPPGAFNDTLARTLAAELPKTLGQQVIVDNRPGGNTIIGTEMAAKSPADGYTLFGAALPFSVIQSLYKTSFDVTKDFAPITLAGVTPNLLVANPSVPFNDVKGLIAYARANPGKLNYASTGNGTSNHLSFELFKSMTGTQVTHVAYKGSAPAVTDLIGGQVQVMFDNTPNVLPHVKGGKLKSARRLIEDAFAVRAGNPDRRRGRRARLRRHRLVWRPHRCRYAARNREAPEHRDGSHSAFPGSERQDHQSGRRRGRRHARALQRLPEVRGGALGEGGPGSRHQGGLVNSGRDNFPELRDAVRELCTRFDSAYWQKIDEQRAYPEAFVEALTKAGWMSALIPEEYGGSGLSLTEATVIMEEVTRSGGNAGCCHGQMYNMNTLLRHGSPQQKQKYLPKIATGELRLQSMGVTEPGAGTDTTKIKTVAVKKGDRYVVNGQKVWTSRLQHSELMILLARTSAFDAQKKSAGMSIFLVDTKSKGIEVRPIRNMVNHETNQLFIDNLEIPTENLIGEEGKGFRYILDGLNAERILIAAECIGDGYWFIEAPRSMLLRESSSTAPSARTRASSSRSPRRTWRSRRRI